LRPTLRPAGSGDESFLRALAASARPALAHLPDELVDLQLEAQRRSYAQRYPGAEDHVVLLDGRPVGRLWTARTGTEWRLLDLALVPEARGRGIGTALLQSLVADADRAGATVRLTVERSNAAARRLYVRLGFAVAGEDELSVALIRTASARPAPPRTRPPARGSARLRGRGR
jgi:ribosomal protein S18 acetylase RimI-like enzyme